jgi:hypothetical protein
MKNIGQKSGDYLYTGSYGAGNPPPDYIHFGEDDQTFFVTEDDIYPVPYELNHYHLGYGRGTEEGSVNVVTGSRTVQGGGTSWLTTGATSRYFGVKGDDQALIPDGKPYEIESVVSNTELRLKTAYQGASGNKGYKISDGLFYGHGSYDKGMDYREYVAGAWDPADPLSDPPAAGKGHLGMPEWGISHSTEPAQDGLNLGTAYRGLNGLAFPGFVLAARIMDDSTSRALWNHDALFGYVDRWVDMMTPYSDPQKEGLYVYGSDFAKSMWLAYRSGVSGIKNYTMFPLPRPVSGTAYPNPAGRSVVITVPDLSIPAVIRIYGPQGSTMTQWEMTAPVSVFTVENLANGVYYYTINHGYYNKTGKLTINR